MHKENQNCQVLLAKPDKLLWEHMVETGYMAKIFLTGSVYVHTADLMMSYTDCSDRPAFISTVCFFVAMHDIGKVHPLFQKMMQTGEKTGFRHEAYSRYILRAYLTGKGIKKRHDTYSPLYRLCDVIGDHHQCKKDTLGLFYEDEAVRDKHYIEALTECMEKYFIFTPFAIKDGCENTFCQLMSGLLRCSDWSASSFADELSCEDDEAAYIKQVKDRCRRYIRDGHIEAWDPASSYPYSRLFQLLTEESLYPLQKGMETVIKEHHTPDCVLIEDQPGSGKTEAAIYTAINLIKACGKQGLYFALPTGATAEAMLPRLKALQRAGLFTDTDPKLFTGTAWMRDIKDEDCEDKALWDDWTEKGPRKLFSSFACGTVDQLMTAGQKIKACDMRLFGLSDKIVIIDEFHSYDAYMMDSISVVLRWLKAMHVPVIILSATLWTKTRKELMRIYADDVSVCESHGYPRITVADSGQVSSWFPSAATEKTYDISMIKTYGIEKKVIDSVSTGGCTLYIANTVKKAYQIYKKLEKTEPDDVTLILYTARTTPEVKEKLGEKLVYLYGKEGKEAGMRPKKSIVIATQICEMSMDVDFDTVFSELAPMDSLIQRLGREKRHDDKGTVRELGFRSIFYVVIPDKAEGWDMPYSEDVLLATEKVLGSRQSVKVPDDIPELIDTVYDTAGTGWIKEQTVRRAYGMTDLMSLPGNGYKKENYLKSRVDTRYVAYDTVKVMCLPEGETIRDDRTWCANMVYRHSVSMPEYIYNKGFQEGDGIDGRGVPVWIKGYHIIKDSPELWGENSIFIAGLK